MTPPDEIAMSAPDIDEHDVDAVAEVVRSGRLALGDSAVRFEEAVAAQAGVRFGVATSSGTAALHTLVRALGIGRGDEVLVPSFTFAASVNAILYEGATPVFVDVEPDTYNLDASDLKAKVTPRTKAIMAVDVFGHPVEWDRIEAVARHHGLLVIDDACEAIGAEYQGRAVGSFGDAGAFAFYPNKQLTTGEGGMIVTDDEDLARACRSLRNQGRAEMGGWLEHERLGFNYRMDEMSAALGLSQIGRLPTFLQRRDEVATRYSRLLSEVEGVRAPVVRPEVRMSWFVYVVTLSEGIPRDQVMAAMAEDGIPTRAYFSPVHLQPYITRRLGDLRGSLRVTESVGARTLALPFHNQLTESQAERVAVTLGGAIRRRWSSFGSARAGDGSQA